MTKQSLKYFSKISEEDIIELFERFAELLYEKKNRIERTCGDIEIAESVEEYQTVMETIPEIVEILDKLKQ